MKRYISFCAVFLFISTFSFAQSVFGSLAEAKSKIEATVPVVIEHLKKISEKENDPAILSNGKEALAKQYNIVSEEFDLYKGNLGNCILNNKAKKATKCMNYHTQYFRNTLVNYDNFISYITKKNGYLGVDDETVKKDFKPTEIATSIDKDFMAASGISQSMKGQNKVQFFNKVKNDDMKLASFNSLMK